MEYQFTDRLTTGAVQLRWLTANCYEIKLPGGKTIVIDPFMPPAEGGYEKWNHYSCGKTAEDLEGCDYALVGHPHGDHIGSLPEVYDRFQPRVICHSAFAILMTTELHIPQQNVMPIENNQHYEFPDFTLDSAVARHSHPDKMPRFEKLRVPDEGTMFAQPNIYGAMFNTNYIITTKTNMKIAFCAGTFEPEERARWKNAGINVLLRQCGSLIKSKNYEQMAQDMMDVNAEIMLPLHHESTYGVEDIIDFCNKVNEVLASRGYAGRMFMPERTRWYKLGLDIQVR